MLVKFPVENVPEVDLEPDQPLVPPLAEQELALVELHLTVVAPLKDKLVLSAVMSTVGNCTGAELTLTVTESDALPKLFRQFNL